MISILTRITHFTITSIFGLFQFLLILLMGILAGIALALPWLLRFICLGIFLAGIYSGMETIQFMYSRFSPALPVFALQFALILAANGFIIFMLQHKASYFWGSSILIGSLLIGASHAAHALPIENKYALFLVQVLPATAMTALWLHEAVRLRKIFKTVRTTTYLTKGNDRHESDENQSERRDLEPAE